MAFVLQPWHLAVLSVAGWINRQQQEAINYLGTQSRVLIETHGGRRIVLPDDQRRRLAVKVKVLGRKRLEATGTLVAPDTIMRWHRTEELQLPSQPTVKIRPSFFTIRPPQSSLHGERFTPR